jgi:hypothetical protein
VSSTPRPTVIIDECLPQAQFGGFFSARGYPVLTVGQAFPRGSPDSAVLAVAEVEAAIIVSTDRDWRGLLRNVPAGWKGGAGRAGRILFNNCNHATALARLQELVDDIEREIDLARRSGRRLLIRITQTTFTTER